MSHVAQQRLFKGDVRMETEEAHKITLTVRSYQYMKDILAKLNDMQLSELNLVIEEIETDEMDNLACLYQVSRFCNLSHQKLDKFSLTYKAENLCGNNNAARFVIVTNLLNQLNWDVCRRVNVNLHFNYLDNDPRLDLLLELPVVLSVNGDAGSPCDVKQNERQLQLIERTYSYLEGYL